MPIVNVNLSDIALASSASGALPVSRGPGAVPEFDANLSWDSTNRLQTLKGQASGVGGDRWSLQTNLGIPIAKYDNSGVHIQDMTANSSGLVSRAIPSQTGYPVTWNVAQEVAPQTLFGNAVASLGWNTTGLGQRENLLWPTFRIGFESNYEIGAEFWMEGHLFAYIDPDTGNETRPLTVVVNKSNGWSTDTLMQGSSWTWQNRGQTFQIAQLTRATDESVNYKISGKLGSDVNGYPIQLISDAVTPQDNFFVGRKFGLNNGITVLGSTSASLSLTRQGVATRLVNDGNFAFINSAGQLMFFRSDDHVFCSRDTARIGLRLQDTGSAMKVGLNGATPVAKGTITGSRGGNAALASLLTYLASRGDLTDNTTA